jgi:hypothetical protein
VLDGSFWAVREGDLLKRKHLGFVWHCWIAEWKSEWKKGRAGEGGGAESGGIPHMLMMAWGPTAGMGWGEAYQELVGEIGMTLQMGVRRTQG